MMKVEYMTHSGDDLLVVNAARCSFGKESEWEKDGDIHILSEKDRKLIHYLAREKHVLPFRHPTLTLRCRAPIFVARQLGKSQVGMSWSEESLRYITPKPEFYWPEGWRKKAENVKQGSSEELCGWMTEGEEEGEGDIISHRDYITKYVEGLAGLYEEMLENGVCPEQARMILPQNTMVTWVWTGTLLAWAHLLSLRLHPSSQKETREFAKLVEDIVANIYPESYEALSKYK